MIDELLPNTFVTHISLHEFCFCPQTSQLSGKFLSFVGVTSRNDNVRPRFGEGDRGRASNSGQRSRNQNYLL